MEQKASLNDEIVNKFQTLLELSQKLRQEKHSTVSWELLNAILFAAIIISSFAYFGFSLYLKVKQSSSPTSKLAKTNASLPRLQKQRKSFSPTFLLLNKRRTSRDLSIDSNESVNDVSVVDGHQRWNFVNFSATERLRLLSNFMGSLNYSMTHMLIAMEKEYRDDLNVIELFDYSRLDFVPTKIEIAFFLLSYSMNFDEFLEYYVSAERIRKFKCEENISDYVIKIIYEINGVN